MSIKRTRDIRTAWRLLGFVGLLAGAGLGLAPAWAGSALLDRPALVNVRASTSVLFAVARAAKRLVTVGEQGIILLSDDDGASWRQAKVPSSVALTNVRFYSAQKGWVVGHGGLVLSTEDGGETWVKRLDGRQAAQIELGAAGTELAQGQGHAVDQRRLAEAERLVADGPDKPFLDIHFTDTNNGMVVGAYGLAFATRDGGRTWQSLKGFINNPKGKHLYAIHAVAGELYLTGEQGALYRSIDGVKRFAELKTPYAGTYFGAISAPGWGLITFGLRGNAYRTADGGANWQKIETGLPVTITAGTRLADGSLLLVDESGRALRSSADGALSFRPVTVRQPSAFTGVVQASDGNLILTGVRGISRLPIETTVTGHKT